MSLHMKRIYERPDGSDGLRILVDGSWPWGCKPDAARVDVWWRDLAPSTQLRTWFGSDPGRWSEFIRRYRQELQEPEKQKFLVALRKLSRQNTVTLVFAAGEPDKNVATALAGILNAEG